MKPAGSRKIEAALWGNTVKKHNRSNLVLHWTSVWSSHLVPFFKPQLLLSHRTLALHPRFVHVARVGGQTHSIDDHEFMG